MTPEQTELARRLVAHERWEWREGMRACTIDGLATSRVYGIDFDGEWDTDGLELHGAVPDLTDAATAGVLLEMLREEVAQMTHHSDYETSLSPIWYAGAGWSVRWISYPTYEGVEWLSRADGDTLGEACARALLAVWEEAMSDDYTPGAGARTLRWVEGMVSIDGWRYLGGSAGRLAFAVEDDTDHAGVVFWVVPADVDGPPDLTDRATFLLALDQLAERGWGLSPDSPWRFAWVKHSDCPEALDRALWETRDHEGEERWKMN